MSKAEAAGRIVLQRFSQMSVSINTIVRHGSYVMVGTETILTIMMTHVFSQTGTCDFYLSKEGFFPIIQSLVGQKYSPLVPAISKRIMMMTEFGFRDLWIKEILAKSTLCLHAPTTVTVTKSFTLANLWGMFVVLSVGYIVSLGIFTTEIIATSYTDIQRGSNP
ncbi:uncharacterized protein [Panulirus ornatus]|uniref:uncharacterized protein n=1 Tax=Panulirus ornatus TaxID=150431 RepID=UPI003A84B2CB